MLPPALDSIQLERRMPTKKKTRRSSTSPDVIANQVFVGLPWTLRKRYDRTIDWMRTRSPLSFVVVGRYDSQDAEDLLAVIEERVETSSYGIFDATGGNPNVSLEYGYAEAIDLPRVLYVSTHGAAKRASKDAPIIADLAGKRRNQYKQEAGLKRLFREFSKAHPYTIRFKRFMSADYRRAAAGQKKRARALALKVIHRLDGTTQVRRADVVQELQADVSRYSADEVDEMIRRLHRVRLIRSQQGRYSRVEIA